MMSLSLGWICQKDRVLFLVKFELNIYLNILLMWKIVGDLEVSVIYIYIYIDYVMDIIIQGQKEKKYIQIY